MSESIVLDLCRELADRLPWAVVGDTVFPEDTLPRGVMTDSAESVAGGLRIETDPNQGSPEYSDGTAEPGLCAVRIVLSQPTTEDVDDLPMLIERRVEAVRVLSNLTGRIGA